MTTNFRALAQELNTLLVYVASTHPDLHETVRRAVLYCSDRARTAIATPPPEPLRPELPSLREQALEQLKCVDADLRKQGIINTDKIRCALERLKELEKLSSFKKEAYNALDTYIYGEPDPKDKERTYNAIRQALEALPND